MIRQGHTSNRQINRWVAVVVIIAAALIGAAPAASQVSVPVTVQEGLYSGVTGVNRTQGPVTVGIPIPDSANITSISQLGLSGASVAQFRVLARWPSGNIKWVLVDSQANVSAGQSVTPFTLTSGSGNSGGANLAADNGSTIAVDTGVAQFTIRKANYDVFDKVVVNGVTVLDNSVKPNAGLVVVGPASGTSCSGACTTEYKSTNDNASTCSIEENGPARAALKCTGAYVNGSTAYMRFTVRMYFYKGLSSAKLNVSLRNADDTTTDNSFQSANKGMTANELRLSPILAAGRGFAFGNHTSTPTTGSFTGTENAYIYQAYSTNLKDVELNAGYLSGSAGAYAQSGYQITQGTTRLTSGTSAQIPEGWADLYDANGAGMEIGVYQASAFWPKSLQFQNGGDEVRVGIWPDQKLFACSGTGTCAVPYYMPWPQHSIHDVYVKFHTATPSNATRSADFKAFQFPLIGRAPYDWYNKADVFQYKIPNPTDEDNFYKQQGQAAGEPNPANYTYSDIVPSTWRFHGWHNTGGYNQHDFRLANLLNWLQRGSTGRYLDAAHFYRYVSELGLPRADGFHWNAHAATDGRVDAAGFPTFSSSNTPSVAREWMDQEHAHVYGMFAYYMMTGDETMHDFILDGPVTRWMNPNVYLAAQFKTADSTGGGACVEAFAGNWGCGIWNERALGAALHAGANLYEFLKSTGDMTADVDRDCSTYPAVCGPMSMANLITKGMVLQDLKANGYGTRQAAGTSPILGVHHLGPQNGCGGKRNLSPFFEGILLNGLYAVARTNGPSWPQYWQLMDKIEGVAQWGANTAWNASTRQNWYNMYLDVANSSCTAEGYTLQNNVELATFWTMQHEYEGGSNFAAGFGDMVRGQFGWSMYADLWSYTLKDGVYRLKNPTSRPQLVTVPVTNFTSNGSGSYTLTWSSPGTVSQYRLKYAAGKQIVNWVRYNPTTNAFVDDPNTQWPWFSATEATAPATNATTITVTGLPTGLTAANFQLRAYITSGAAVGDTTAPVPSITAPANGSTVSGVVAVSGTATDNVGVSSVQFAIDGTVVSTLTAAPFGFSWTTTQVANGSHTISMTATDAAGNSATSSATVTVSNVVADTTAPTVAISAPANAASVNGTVAITATASDNVGVASVAFSIDGTALATDTAAPYTASWNSTTVANGTHTITAVARDAAGNSSTATATVTVNNPDTTAPTVAISAPANNASVNGTVAITATASDNVGVASVAFSIDGTALATDTAAPYTASWNSTTVANGTHTITAVARDAAGNSSTATATVTVNNPDTTAPTVAISAPANNASVNGTVAITATASDNIGVASVAFSIDGTALTTDTTAPYTASWTSTAVANGTHTITAVARDAAGNTATATATVTVNNPDKTAPTVAISAPANNATVSGVVSITASASDNVGVASVAFSVDGTTLTTVTAAPYTASWTSTSATNGTHTITAVAKDVAGNSATATATVTVSNSDRTAPTVSLTAPADGATVNGTVSITATASDNVGVASVAFSVDGTVLSTDTSSPYSASWNTSTIANGAHTISAVAKDAAGNSTTATSTVTVNNPDRTSPTVSITSPANGVTVNGVVSISASASDNIGVASVAFSVDGAALTTVTAAPFTAAWDSTTAAPGQHSISVVASDAAGNQASAQIGVIVPVPVTDAAQPIKVNANTQFTVDEQDLNVIVACPKCYFQNAADMMQGQSTEIWLDSTGKIAARVILKQGTIDGTVQSVGTNSFTITPSAAFLPTTITVSTGNVTTLASGTPTVGQKVAIRGILLKHTGSGGPTLVAKTVELLP